MFTVLVLICSSRVIIEKQIAVPYGTVLVPSLMCEKKRDRRVATALLGVHCAMLRLITSHGFVETVFM